MSEIIANCARITPASASLQNHLNAFVDWMTANGIYWTVTDTTLSGSDVEAVLLSCIADDQQIELAINAGNITVLLDPDGERTALSESPSAAASDAQVCMDSGSSYGDRANVMEYPDALIWALLDPTLVFYQEGVHVGLIMTPFNANDPARGVSGHGFMCRQSQFSTGGSIGIWASGQNNPLSHDSRIRIGTTAWQMLRCMEFFNANQSGQVLSALRFTPVVIGVTDEDNVRLGTTRYLRSAASTDAARTVLPATSAEIEQAFLYLGYRTSSDALLVLWRKGVTP